MNRKVFLLPFIIALIGIGFNACNCNSTCDSDKTKKETIKEDKKMKKVAILLGEGFHDGEAYMPLGYLANRGIKTCVIGPNVGEVKAYNSDFTIKIQKSIEDVSVECFDALILPGGKAPGNLRENKKIVQFAKDFYNSGKPIAAICHGPQILITAGIMDGKKCTAFMDVQSEVEEAGGTYLDKPLVIDNNIITSRIPKDLNDFSKAIYKALK